MVELHIPSGINYECTGCGKCCGGWAVPMTDADYERIVDIDWGNELSKFKGKKLFRSLTANEKKDTPNTHAIIPGEDGHCPFLVDNLCFIHSRYGAQTKPSICQLFPYSFNETPSGVYATVSFNSMGAIYNAGAPLINQRELLTKKWEDFRALYPNHHPNWSTLKLAVGVPMSWDEYLSYEGHILNVLSDKTKTFEERLLDCSKYLVERLKQTSSSTSSTQIPESLNTKQMKAIDKHLLVALQKLYYPSKVSLQATKQFSIAKFVYQLAFEKPLLSFPGQKLTFEELNQFPWCDEFEDIIFRYFYSRVFGKYYFGAGLGQLSLIAGFHHLAYVYALIKLQTKGSALLRGATEVNVLDLIPAIRGIEKRLSELVLDGYAAGFWELLMYSPQRLTRVFNGS